MTNQHPIGRGSLSARTYQVYASNPNPFRLVYYVVTCQAHPVSKKRVKCTVCFFLNFLPVVMARIDRLDSRAGAHPSFGMKKPGYRFLNTVNQLNLTALKFSYLVNFG